MYGLRRFTSSRAKPGEDFWQWNPARSCATERLDHEPIRIS
jgi:hypothetical protein